jgi:hypothetical protein
MARGIAIGDTITTAGAAGKKGTGGLPEGSHLRRDAQFIRFCRASNLAEARRISSPWQGSSPAKTRAASRPSRAYGHHLRPATNGEQLSGTGSVFPGRRPVRHAPRQ